MDYFNDVIFNGRVYYFYNFIFLVCGERGYREYCFNKYVNVYGKVNIFYKYIY